MRGRLPAADWSRLPLGLVSDRVIAEVVGVTVMSVYRQRKKRGIKGFRGACSDEKGGWRHD